MNHRSRTLAAASRYLVVAALAVAAAAQDSPVVTGVLDPRKARFLGPEGTSSPARIGETTQDKQLQVDADNAVLIHSPSGHATLIVLGPATLRTEVSDTVDFVLESGQIAVRARKNGDSQPARLIVRAATPDEAPRLLAPFGDGTTYADLRAGTLDVGFEAADGAASSDLEVGGETVALASGQRVTIAPDGTQQASALDPWRTEARVEQPDLAKKLILAAARARRIHVADELFYNLSSWERFASPGFVKATVIREQNPEIRTVSTTITTISPANTNVQGNVNRLSGNFQTANQVPVFSPAAVSVGGVTAVTGLNNNARSLLTATQARGLGFGGLSLLAVSGFDPVTGLRTVGPPGLGAR